jgi:hypothetical protein
LMSAGSELKGGGGATLLHLRPGEGGRRRTRAEGGHRGPTGRL